VTRRKGNSGGARGRVVAAVAPDGGLASAVSKIDIRF
jgi:hypothetical protein